MKAMEEVFKETMPNEMGFAYMGMSFQEKQAQEGRFATQSSSRSRCSCFSSPRRPIRELEPAL